MKEQFIQLCTIGNLDYIKKLITKQYVNIHVENERGFRWACRHGYLHIVEYLISLYKINTDYTKINIHIKDELGFRWACMNGHLHIVKYLTNLYKIQQSRNTDYKIINIHSYNEGGFNLACENEQKYIVKYLLSIGSYLLNHEYIVLL